MCGCNEPTFFVTADGNCSGKIIELLYIEFLSLKYYPITSLMFYLVAVRQYCLDIAKPKNVYSTCPPSCYEILTNWLMDYLA